MSFCKDCVVAVTHEGTPTGKIEKIGGVDTYVALPEGDYPKDKALLFLTDVFGYKFPNNQLLADDFARNGFQVYMPDYLNDDPITDTMFGNPEWNIGRDWFPRHTKEFTRPVLDKVIAALKEKGVTSFGAAGYCFGARYCIDLAHENGVKSIVLNHPSLLEVPADFEKLLQVSNVPLLINSCEVDQQFPPESQEKTDALLGGGKYKPGYERTYWPGCTHGFAVRGDLSNPQIKAGKEGAFKASVEWLIKTL
ncbi:alpha/beta-hydrolase [Auricularia subglabra TFB-10046 SS5]|nr:alpha/beta-hydrolase [Auricularia subglabra TFB-10046 SS5]